MRRVIESPFSSRGAKHFAKYGRANLFKCKSTGFIFASPSPSPTELGQYYSDKYFAKDRYANRTSSYNPWERRLNSVTNTIATSVQTRPELLDIGAGTGAFVRYACENGWDVSAVEYSSHGQEQIRARVPEVVSIDREFSVENYREQQFTAVTLWAVIEHMPYDPGLLHSLAKIIKPGGVLALSFPNPNTMNRYLFGAKWRYFIPVEHLSFFPPGLFHRILGEAGFRVCLETSVFSSQAFRDGWMHSSLSKLPSLIQRIACRLANRTNRLFWHGDTYEVIAMRFGI